MQEHELIILLKQKNEAAFKQLVCQFQDKVFNTALSMLQSSLEAEDAAQEVFIQVYTSIGAFEGKSALGTWIYRITVTKCLDVLRKKQRKKRMGTLLSFFGKDHTPTIEPVDFVHPGVQLEQKEKAAILFACIKGLPENQQIAFVLHKVEQLSYKEIAQILQTTEGAVDALIQRAKQGLRKRIAEKKME